MKAPVSILATVCSVLLVSWSPAVEPTAASVKTTIKLVSGDTMTGTVGTVKDGSLSLITEYGPVRVPVERLSAETKAKLGISESPDDQALKTRIKELEDLVARLREENATLRRSAAPAIQPAIGGATPSVRSSSTPAPAAEAGGYRISTTGKRHNSRCRYFNSAGRAGSATEGVACKICGG